jgi:hypothetical protein
VPAVVAPQSTRRAHVTPKAHAACAARHVPMTQHPDAGWWHVSGQAALSQGW